jgi:mono/diheme cytochrome c family protein
VRAAPSSGDEAAGARIFKAANCVACHKWSGTGGGGYGGAAANLRKTGLDEEQIAETVRCGHPGGGMPYFQEDAYKTKSCYDLNETDLDVTTAPAAAEHFLQPPEIKAVAHYVFVHFKGKGDPTHEECVGFFGHETRLCDDLPKGDGNDGAASVAGAAGSHHLKIETAPDANAKSGP